MDIMTTPESSEAPVYVAATGLTGMIGARVAEISSDCVFTPLGVDITDREATMAAVAKSELNIVVNFAAFTDVARAAEQWGDRDGPCYQINAVGPRNLSDACALTGKHLIHISTDYVFSGEESRPYTESDVPDANADWYGITKRIGEEYVSGVDAPYSVIRIGSPFQAHSLRKEDVVRRLVRQLRSDSLPPLFNDMVVTPTFVDDLASVVGFVCGAKAQGIFHVNSCVPISPANLARMVATIFEEDGSRIRETSLRDFAAKTGRFYPQRLAMSSEMTLTRLNGPVPRPLPDALAKLRQQIEEGSTCQACG